MTDGTYPSRVARYVIDDQTLLEALDRDLHLNPDHQLVAPNFIRSDALQRLLGDVLAGRRSEADALAKHERLTETKLRLLGDRVSRRVAWQLARENGWDALRDAHYLAVTRLQADALVTVDLDLARRARGVVALAPIDALSTSDPIR